MAYTEKQILIRLRKHLIDNMGSVWTMHKPTWQGIIKRMEKDPLFAEKVRGLVCEANFVWEKMGIAALITNDETFNVQLYKHFTQNKKSFLTHDSLVTEERLDAIEKALKDSSHGKV